MCVRGGGPVGRIACSAGHHACEQSTRPSPHVHHRFVCLTPQPLNPVPMAPWPHATPPALRSWPWVASCWAATACWRTSTSQRHSATSRCAASCSSGCPRSLRTRRANNCTMAVASRTRACAQARSCAHRKTHIGVRTHVFGAPACPPCKCVCAPAQPTSASSQPLLTGLSTYPSTLPVPPHHHHRAHTHTRPAHRPPPPPPCGLQAIYTYEGTYEVNVLVAGRGITRVPAIRASATGPEAAAKAAASAADGKDKERKA